MISRVLPSLLRGARVGAASSVQSVGSKALAVGGADTAHERAEFPFFAAASLTALALVNSNERKSLCEPNNQSPTKVPPNLCGLKALEAVELDSRRRSSRASAKAANDNIIGGTAREKQAGKKLNATLDNHNALTGRKSNHVAAAAAHRSESENEYESEEETAPKKKRAAKKKPTVKKDEVEQLNAVQLKAIHSFQARGQITKTGVPPELKLPSYITPYIAKQVTKGFTELRTAANGKCYATKGCFDSGTASQSLYRQSIFAGSSLDARNKKLVAAKGGSLDHRVFQAVKLVEGAAAIRVNDPELGEGFGILHSDKSDPDVVKLLGKHDNFTELFASLANCASARQLGSDLGKSGWKQDPRTVKRGKIKAGEPSADERLRIYYKKGSKFDTEEGPGQYEGTEFEAAAARARAAKRREARAEAKRLAEMEAEETPPKKRATRNKRPDY